MSGRGTTNALLAIIAGALLFGQSAMVGALKWVAIASAAILAVYVLVRLIAWGASGGASAVREVIDLWQGDTSFLEKAIPLAGLVLIPFGIWFGLTWFWLWFSGVPDAKHAVLGTVAGQTWSVVLFAVMAGALAVGAVKVVVWLVNNRRSVPGLLWSACRYWIIGLFAVIAFPVNEVRCRRHEGSGALGMILAPAGMMFIGFMVSSVTAFLSALGIAALLAGVGVID